MNDQTKIINSTPIATCVVSQNKYIKLLDLAQIAREEIEKRATQRASGLRQWEQRLLSLAVKALEL